MSEESICRRASFSESEWCNITAIGMTNTGRSMKHREKVQLGLVSKFCGAVYRRKIHWENGLKSRKGLFFYPRDGKVAVMSVATWCDRDVYMCHWFVRPFRKTAQLHRYNNKPTYTKVQQNGAIVQPPWPYTFYNHIFYKTRGVL